MSLFDRHHIYLQRHKLLEDARRVPYRNLPYLMVLGDSWLDYPGRNHEFLSNPTNMMRVLMSAQLSSANWYDVAVVGTTTTQLARHLPDLQRLAPRVKLDTILVSAGGNDYFEKADSLLRPYDASLSAAQHLDRIAFESVGLQVTRFYHRLVTLRNRYQPKALIIAHAYLPPVARSNGFLNWGPFRLGPWIAPAMESKGYDQATPEFRTEVIRLMHVQVAETILEALTAPMVPNRGRNYVFNALTVNPPLDMSDRQFWADEVHLSVEGYTRYTQAMIAYLRSRGLFPFRRQ